jgi:hypothetical protein
MKASVVLLPIRFNPSLVTDVPATILAVEIRRDDHNPKNVFDSLRGSHETDLATEEFPIFSKSKVVDLQDVVPVQR